MNSLVCAVLIGLAAPSAVDRRLIPLFESLECRFPSGSHVGEVFRYRLFVPKPLDPEEKYPLLLWLPGQEIIDPENTEQLMHVQNLVNRPDEPSRYPYFILVPQCPEDRSEQFAVTLEALDETIRKYPVDPDRVYLLGISAGGSAVWQFALRYPDRFAALAPLASSGPNPAEVVKLRDVPVWAFHKRDDEIIPLERVNHAVAALREAGGTAHLTVFEGNTHDAWTAALHEYKVVNWMLWQRRGATCWYPPGFRPWNLRQIAAQALIPTVIGLAAWSVWRKRRKRAAEEGVSRTEWHSVLQEGRGTAEGE